jgi:hypothetical protein
MYGYIAVRNILSARFGAFSFVVFSIQRIIESIYNIRECDLW